MPGEDRASGAKAERSGLAALFGIVRRGDIIVIWRLDRLGRSLKDLIQLVERFEVAGVDLKSLQENIDTSIDRIVCLLRFTVIELEPKIA